MARSIPENSNRAALWLFVLLIALAAIAVYANSFSGVLIFDDENWIVNNHDIRELWPGWLLPEQPEALGGRPVVSLTLALNYHFAWHDQRFRPDVWGFHAVNLTIHILAAWLLFGIVRRTLLLPVLRDRFGRSPAWLAFAAALLWTVHPLQTQAVTYIIQRTESLVGLFYLLTLYCVIRGASAVESAEWRVESDRPGTGGASGTRQPVPRLTPHASRLTSFWYSAAVLSCLLGMGTKEVMATAPLVVLLYDRTFLSGSFGRAIAARWGLYLALAATWGVIVWELIVTGFHGGSTGFASAGFDWKSYLLTQPEVLARYLRLVFWPSGQCLDYAWPAANSWSEIALPGLLIVGLLLLTVWALVKRPMLGFLGACFFIVLAPTSSFVPINDAAFEHRMYLPLAAVVVLLVLAFWMAGEWLSRRAADSVERRSAIVRARITLLAFALLGLGIATILRNNDYHTSVGIMQDTVDKAPWNARAHSSLGNFLAEEDDLTRAMEHLRRAVELAPNSSEGHANLGAGLARQGDLNGAIAEFNWSLKIDEKNDTSRNLLALAFIKLGRYDEAIEQYQKRADLDPHYGEAHYRIAQLLVALHKYDEAVSEFKATIAANPRYADHASQFHAEFGAALNQVGNIREAVRQWRTAVRLGATDPITYYSLAFALATSPDSRLRNGQESITTAQLGLRLPKRIGQVPAMLDALAAAYAETGQWDKAVQTATDAVNLALARNEPDVANQLRGRITRYEAHIPLRQAPSGPTQ